jgi:hypothetical protein
LFWTPTGIAWRIASSRSCALSSTTRGNAQVFQKITVFPATGRFLPLSPEPSKVRIFIRAGSPSAGNQAKIIQCFEKFRDNLYSSKRTGYTPRQTVFLFLTMQHGLAQDFPRSAEALIASVAKINRTRVGHFVGMIDPSCSGDSTNLAYMRP